MSKVILGAILGAVIGLFIGWIPRYDYAWEIVQSGSRFTLQLAPLLHPLSMMIGAGTGGIIGAIAGRVAADPNSTPLPRRVGIALLVILGGVIVLGSISAGVYFLSSSSPGKVVPVVPVPWKGQPGVP